MRKVSTLVSFLIIISTISFGQKMGDYYVPVSIDSTQGRRLKFLNDSIVELSSFPRHMSPSIKTVHKYTSTDTTIQIFPEPITATDSISRGLFVQVSFHRINLTKIAGGFIDYDRSLIYVRQKDFDKSPDIIYLIDGKKFIQDTGEQDGYGLVRKGPKTNRALEKKLKHLTKDNCTIELVRGLNAYNRFGINYVFGTIVITTKEKNYR